MKFYEILAKQIEIVKALYYSILRTFISFNVLFFFFIWGIKLLADIFNPMLQYKRAGVVLSGITPVSSTPSLFELPAQKEIRLNRERLMHAVDSLNDGAGPHVVKLASQLTKGHIGHNDGYSSSFGAPSI